MRATGPKPATEGILDMRAMTDPEDDDDEDAGPSPAPWEWDGSADEEGWVG